MLRSDPAFVATCTPASGLHSSSSTTRSYVYFALASWLRSFTARSAELRPPSPIAEFPPVSGPTNAIFTVSFALAAAEARASTAHSTAWSIRIAPPPDSWGSNLAHRRCSNSTTERPGIGHPVRYCRERPRATAENRAMLLAVCRLRPANPNHTRHRRYESVAELQ